MYYKRYYLHYQYQVYHFYTMSQPTLSFDDFSSMTISTFAPDTTILWLIGPHI